MTYSSSLAMGRRSRLGDKESRNSRALGPNLWGKNQNTASFQKQKGTIGPISNTIILVILASLVGLLYLTQVTKTNAYSYQLDDLKQQQTALENRRDELTVESARLQAQARVKNSDVAKNLVTVAPASTVQN